MVIMMLILAIVMCFGLVSGFSLATDDKQTREKVNIIVVVFGLISIFGVPFLGMEYDKQIELRGIQKYIENPDIIKTNVEVQNDTITTIDWNNN